MKKLVFLSLAIITLSGCTFQKKEPKAIIRHIPLIAKSSQSRAIKSNFSIEPNRITIWIHGTRMSKHILPRFSYSMPGLNHYTKTSHKYYLRDIADTLIESNPNIFPPETFYLYGWNGALSRSEREKAAHQLYYELKEVREAYVNKHGKEPYIQILSHSHGGNVALLLEKVKDPSDINFSIDRVILLACPVQKNTKNMAHSSVFKKIYSLYSVIDFLQIADPQGLKNRCMPFFSQRHFDHCENITQVHMKINGRSFRHLDFILRRFLRNLVHVIEHIDLMECNECHLRNNSIEKILCLESIKKAQ